jgi:hypothetical protein
MAWEHCVRVLHAVHAIVMGSGKHEAGEGFLGFLRFWRSDASNTDSLWSILSRNFDYGSYAPRFAISRIIESVRDDYFFRHNRSKVHGGSHGVPLEISCSTIDHVVSTSNLVAIVKNLPFESSGEVL